MYLSAIGPPTRGFPLLTHTYSLCYSLTTMKPLAPRILCEDGTVLSVQASQYHYCSPREDEGPYSRVEVGFIKDATGAAVTPPEDWREYGDGCFPSDVYGYVPVELVEAFITEHGGRTATS